MSDFRQAIRNAAVNEAVKEDSTITTSVYDLVNNVWPKFLEYQLKNFPAYCRHAYQVNKQHNKELEDYGNKGKYTDTYGWSNDGTMKHKWIVPQDLKMFMQNLVYIDFWEETNAKARDSFMNQICKGGTSYDYEQLLKKVTLYYGTDPKKPGKKIVTN